MTKTTGLLSSPHFLSTVSPTWPCCHKTDNVHLSTIFWSIAFGEISTLKIVYLNAKTSTFWWALNLADRDSTDKSDQRFFLTLGYRHVDLQLVLLISVRRQASTEPFPFHVDSCAAMTLTELRELVQVVENDEDGESRVDLLVQSEWRLRELTSGNVISFDMPFFLHLSQQVSNIIDGSTTRLLFCG